MKITCEACFNIMNVDDSMRGKKGKCPRCKSLVSVPEFTEDELIFDADDIYGKYPETQSLYEKMNEKYGKRIVSVHINTLESDDDNRSFDGITMVIKTGKYNDRSQTVTMITCKLDDNPAGELFIVSSVGDIDLMDEIDYPELLRVVINPKITISISDDDILQIRSLASLSKNELDRTCDIIVDIANLADNLEKLYSDSDIQ